MSTIQVVAKALKVDKTDIYNYQVNTDWLGIEEILTATITIDALKVTLNDQRIQDNIIFMSLTGVSSGDTIIHIQYTTATRIDCYQFALVLLEC